MPFRHQKWNELGFLSFHLSCSALLGRALVAFHNPTPTASSLQQISFIGQTCGILSPCSGHQALWMNDDDLFIFNTSWMIIDEPVLSLLKRRGLHAGDLCISSKPDRGGIAVIPLENVIIWFCFWIFQEFESRWFPCAHQIGKPVPIHEPPP